MRNKLRGARGSRNGTRPYPQDDARARSQQQSLPLLPDLDALSPSASLSRNPTLARSAQTPRSSGPSRDDAAQSRPRRRRTAADRQAGEPEDAAYAPSGAPSAARRPRGGSSSRYRQPSAYPADEPWMSADGAHGGDIDGAPATDVRSLVPAQPHGMSPASVSAARSEEARLPALLGARDGGALILRAESDSSGMLIRGATRQPQMAATVIPRRKGPLSFMAQFVISMVTAAVIFSAVAVASPIGQAATVNTTFHTYANAVPWIPTPTPTPTATPTPKPVAPTAPPAGSNPGAQAIMDDIRAVFGPYSNSALAIARCESGYDPNAWNPYPIGGSHASGVFQLLFPSTWDTTSYASSSPFNADANIHAAYQLFSRDGYSWREWQCASVLG